MKKPVLLCSIHQAILAASIAMVFGVFCLAVGVAGATEIDWLNDVSITLFKDMQAVNSDGSPTWSVPTLGPPDYQQAYRLRGVVLNDPAKMLDSTAGAGFLGGEWQVYIQTTETDPEIDFGGAALFVAEKYTHVGSDNDYTELEWESEMARLNYPVYDPTGLGVGPIVDEPLRTGDLIEVHARAGMFFRGKFNCNEEHDTDPDMDFDIIILQRDVLLDPTDITLTDVMYADGSFIFDELRETGAEFYQAQYVTLQDVTITGIDEDWGVYGQITVTDGTREFVVKLGQNDAFDLAAEPSGTLDITGIFDQEAADGNYQSSYRMWATSPADFAPAVALIPGDANGDDVVNEDDAARLAEHWGTSEDASWFDGDFNGDRCVGPADAAILAANWGAEVSEETSFPVPEPGALGLLTALGAAVCRRIRRSGCA